MKNMVKTASIILLLVLSMLTVSVTVLGGANDSPLVYAATLPTNLIRSVEIGGHDVLSSLSNNDRYRRGEKLDIEVNLVNDAPGAVYLEDLFVEATLVYEYETKISDSTQLFDLAVQDDDWFDLSLKLPKDIKAATVDLRILVMGRRGEILQKVIPLRLEGETHSLSIERVLFTPQDRVQAGSFLVGKVRIENFGTKKEDDVLVGARVRGLAGASDTDIINEIGYDNDNDKDSKSAITSEELFLQIPPCAKAGTYTVEIDVYYFNDKYHAQETFEIEVVEGDADLCAGTSKTSESTMPQIVFPTTVSELKGGESVTFPMTVLNPSRDAKVFIVETSGHDEWAKVTVSPSNLITLKSGELKALTLTATAKDGVKSGEKLMILTVKTQSGEIVKQETIRANLMGSETKEGSSYGTLKTVIKVAILVLVVLVILIVLIIAFNKLKSDDDFDDDSDEEDKTYY